LVAAQKMNYKAANAFV